MMNQETFRKLIEMKMGAMAEVYQQQSQNKDYKSMDFDDKFNLLVDYGTIDVNQIDLSD